MASWWSSDLVRDGSHYWVKAIWDVSSFLENLFEENVLAYVVPKGIVSRGGTKLRWEAKPLEMNKPLNHEEDLDSPFKGCSLFRVLVLIQYS